MKEIKYIGAYQRGLALIFVVVAILLAAGGYWFYCSQARAIRNEKYNDLKTIAELKIGQIIEWRKERLADSRIYSSGVLRAGIRRWIRSGNDTALKKAVLKHLEFLSRTGRYQNIIVTDPEGKILISLNPSLVEPESMTRQLVAQAAASRRPVFGDLFRCPFCKSVHLDVAAPILNNEGLPLAVLMLRSDAEKRLFPLIQSWPVPTKSAETLIVRREGDNVIFLNKLRHSHDQPLNFQIPMSRKEVPAVQAVMGREGECEGIDYRGVHVLADIRRVPDTPWFMVAKVDSSEILSEARHHGGAIIVLVFLAILMTGTIAGYFYKSRQKIFYEDLFRAEKDKRAALDEISATLYSIGDAVIATDVGGLVQRMNHVAERLTGWDEAEAIGRPVSEVFCIVNEETRSKVEDPVARVLRERQVVGLANHSLLVARDGTERPIADSGSPIINEHGDITGVVLVFRDQTEERAMQKVILREKDTARKYLDIAGVMMVVLDASANVILINKKGCEILGFNEEDILGKNWFDHFLPETLREEIKGVFSHIIAGEAPLHDYGENAVLCKNGEERIIAWHNTVIRDEAGNIVGTLSSGDAITARKAMEEQLRQVQKMEAVGQLAGGVAHDFNNMLGVIIGNAELAMADCDRKDTIYNYLTEILNSSMRSANLVRQLLAFARKQMISPRVLDLNEIISGILNMLSRLIGEDIKLEWMPGQGLWQIRMDPAQVDQIMANLVVNARDAMGGGGVLTIKTANAVLDEAYCINNAEVMPGEYVLVSVSDTGSGMDENTLNRIFDPFFTTKEVGKGTGLGLSTVYGIVKQNKGHILVKTEQGKGSTFEIYLPRTQELDKPDPGREAKSPPGGKETILLVEDEKRFLDLAKTVLLRQGYTVLVAQTPAEALVIAARLDVPIELLLTDMIMPGMNGVDLQKKVKELRPGIKTLFMSGYTIDKNVYQHTLEAGVKILEKPFSARELTEKVRDVLDAGEIEK
ncbi:Multi-sensor hybrid histidine kinase [uncultured Desulfobacterium sp.]|uniref:histidine kinase n=1 Tax=uncultured Desulfobacterium sp. TaxID=201089 RepID=A0A445N0J4_9BACT|nr:Multi-sensor hybrid histidine kinase [uncultured Desulfobacterium sp.]